MTIITTTLTRITDYFQRSDTLPSFQLRRLGLVYSSYRLIVSIFFLLSVYLAARADASLLLPPLLQQTALLFYFMLSLILLGLLFVINKRPQRLLSFGLALDIIILSLLLYTNGAPDLQLSMLYMVVVAASFMLLHSSQASIITLLAIIFVIYQQFFYAIANSMSLTNLGDALLMSASFLVVGFLSWTISQRLLHIEQVAIRQAQEVERLNDINQEVVSQMINGVIVIEEQQIVLANQATYQLLSISNGSEAISNTITTHLNDGLKSQYNSNLDSKLDPLKTSSLNHAPNNYYCTSSTPLLAFQQQLIELHPLLLDHCLIVPTGHARTFTYELPTSTTNASTLARLRVQIIPLKNNSRMIILEDLRREQANAQQLKLASLGQLTASIAHEIRNPLSAISQASQLLMEDLVEDDRSIAEPIDSNNHELYEMIFTQTKRVNRIIEDVLKLSRQQPPNQQSIDLRVWIPEFLVNHFSGHDVFLKVNILLKHYNIRFDSNQLEQILVNLITNGLRYSSESHPHAYVDIEIYNLLGEIIIDILDDGVGISSANIEHLFEPFFTTSKSGTGLGLYLSQAFSEANHARLVYVTDHQKTCFRLILPIV